VNCPKNPKVAHVATSGAPPKKGFTLAKSSKTITPLISKNQSDKGSVREWRSNEPKKEKKLSKKTSTFSSKQQQSASKVKKVSMGSFPNLPKGPKNAYMQFVEENRPRECVFHTHLSNLSPAR
jgi:hypothetical protein